MISNKYAVTTVALVAMVAFSACSRHTSTPQSTSVDSSVAAEQELNKTGCKFEQGAQRSTTGSESETKLNCPAPKNSAAQSTQIKALTTYTSKISATMKQKDRKDMGPLQVKLSLASSKLVELESAAKFDVKASAAD